jgi:hypothetical protein
MALSFTSTVIVGQAIILGTTDIPALIKEAPGLPPDLSTAGKRAYGDDPVNMDYEALDRFYGPFEAKVNGLIARYEQYAQDKMESNEATQEDYYQQAIQDINSSPIISNMGGYEKIAEMSEEEVRVAAMQATAEYAASSSGGQSTGMAAMMQKMANDPAYAERVDAMSDTEMEAELRKYMAGDKPSTKSPADMAADQARVSAQQSETELLFRAQEIQSKIGEWTMKLAGVATTSALEINGISNSPGNHQEIDAIFRAKYDEIPLVIIGEGYEADPAISVPLRISMAKQHQARATEELSTYREALQKLSREYQDVASAYLGYIKQNGNKIYGGTSALAIMHGQSTELALLSFESYLIGLALDLSKQSKHLVKETGQWERLYQDVIR